MPSTLSQSLQASVSNDPRNKEWEDLNYDQKTERLMEVVHRLHETVTLQSQTIFNLNKKLTEHEHDEDGGAFVREYLDHREKKFIEQVNIPYSPHVSNPLNVRALKPKAESDMTETERPY